MPGLELMGKIGLDGKGFEAELHKARHLAKGVSEGITDGLKRAVLTGVGIATVEQAFAKTVETASELVETSKRLAIAPEQLQILRQAAKESGVEIDKLTQAFERVYVAREKALIPGKEGASARRAFAAFGINGAQLHGSQSGADLFMGPMANAAKNINPEQLGIAFKELGIRGFAPLIGLLKTDFGELGKKMNEMGAIMDAETAVKLKMISNELSLLAQIITSQVGPALIKMAEWIYENILKTGKTVSGAAGFYGAGTAKQGPLEAAGTMAKAVGYGAVDIYQRMFHGRSAAESRKYLRGKLSGAGFDLGAGAEGAANAEKPWQAGLNSFQAMMEKARKEAEELRHPKRPDFTKSLLPQKLSNKALMDPSDSLVKVGNFLGGRGMGGLETRKIDLLSQIASNTASLRSRGSVAGRTQSATLSTSTFPHR